MDEMFLREMAEAFWELLRVINPALQYGPSHCQGVVEYMRKIHEEGAHPSVVAEFSSNGIQLASQVDDPDILMVMLIPTWVKPKV